MLIADDNRQITDILSEYAKKKCFSVTRAYDGEEALRLFRAGAYEMVLLDVMMPKKRRIRGLPEYPERNPMYLSY